MNLSKEVVTMTEQSQNHTQAITLADWEGNLRSLSFEHLTAHVNYLYQVMVFYVRQTAAHIWCIGRALNREKELVGHGRWMDHCRRFHPEISLDSIERYMKLATKFPTDQVSTLLDKTPSQAYRMLDEIKKRRSLPRHPTKQDNRKANSAQMRNFPKGLWASGLDHCPHCNGSLWFTLEGNRLKIRAVKFQ